MQSEMTAQGPREPKSTLPFVVDSLLAVEKTRVRTQVRDSHLKLRDVVDPRTVQILERLNDTEEFIRDIVADELHGHPAYFWFSRIKGIGDENIAKVVGMMDVRKAPHISSFWRYAGMHVINIEVSPEDQQKEITDSIDGLQKKLDELRKKAAKKAKTVEAEEADEAAEIMTPAVVGDLINSISTKLGEELTPITRGYAPRRSMYKADGKKLDYNSELRVMCFRLAGSLIKARGKYAEYYDDVKNQLAQKYRNQGVRIIPTLELPKLNGKIFEPVGTIAAGHVHMQAIRKMIKLFLSHLWLVWRKAEGLPISQPYAHDKLGHTHIIDPWDMVEKPERKRRQRTSTERSSSQ